MKILAKQLLALRKQKTRSMQANSQITGIRMQGKVSERFTIVIPALPWEKFVFYRNFLLQTMTSNVKMSEAMASTTQAMHNMNEHLSPQQVGQIMQEFSKESAKMDMSEEMSKWHSALLFDFKLNTFLKNYLSTLLLLNFVFLVNETLDDILTESGDESEENVIVSRILDEIGIEVGGQVRSSVLLMHCDKPYLQHFVLYNQISKAPAPSRAKIGDAAQKKKQHAQEDEEAAEIEAQLARLKAE